MIKFSDIINSHKTYRQARELERALKHGIKNEFDETLFVLRVSAKEENFPATSRRRRYLSVPVALSQSTTIPIWLKIAEIGLATASLTLVISLVAASKPGQTLHPYKIAARQFKVSLAPTAQDRAVAAVNIAQENYEAVARIVQENSPSKQKQAAIAEVTKQTRAAIKRVASISKQPTDKAEKKAEQEQLAQQLTVLATDQLELAKAVAKGVYDSKETEILLADAALNAETAVKLEHEIAGGSEKEMDGKNTEKDIMNEKEKVESAKNTRDVSGKENTGTQTGGGETEVAPKVDATKTKAGGKPPEEEKDDIILVLPMPKTPQIQGGFIPEAAKEE